MDTMYFNHTAHIAKHRLDRHFFVAHWWRLYARDPRWVPPHYSTLRRELEPARNGHLARLAPTFLHVEAVLRIQTSTQRGPTGLWNMPTMAPLERPVAAAVSLRDPRREDGSAYLAFLHCVNDPPSLRHLLDFLSEQLWPQGCRRLIGPTGLSPHLETGLLQDYWDELPPLHTAYNPPYLPEMVSSTMRPLGRMRLYHLKISPERPPASPSQAQLSPLEPARLATRLLPLLKAACPLWAGIPPPDAQEAAFLLRWLGRWPLYGWLATVRGEPVGFILLQPDLSPVLRRARGGRNLLWRPWLNWASQRSMQQGRLLYGAVLPRWRAQGIGRQLLHQALITGHVRGWRVLTIGPLPNEAAACAFLERHGACPRQTYLVYEWDF